MKKISAVVALVLALVLCGSACADLYPTTARVTKVDRSADLVTVETVTGLLFTFEGCEDWEEGDCCSLLMDDNGTDSVLDDLVLDAIYSGWILSR